MPEQHGSFEDYIKWRVTKLRKQYGTGAIVARCWPAIEEALEAAGRNSPKELLAAQKACLKLLDHIAIDDVDLPTM